LYPDVIVSGNIWVDGIDVPYQPHEESSAYTFHGSVAPGLIHSGSTVTFFFVIQDAADPSRGAYRFASCQVVGSIGSSVLI
jgi:hypothetical protein